MTRRGLGIEGPDLPALHTTGGTNESSTALFERRARVTPGKPEVCAQRGDVRPRRELLCGECAQGAKALYVFGETRGVAVPGLHEEPGNVGHSPEGGVENRLQRQRVEEADTVHGRLSYDLRQILCRIGNARRVISADIAQYISGAPEVNAQERVQAVGRHDRIQDEGFHVIGMSNRVALRDEGAVGDTVDYPFVDMQGPS